MRTLLFASLLLTSSVLQIQTVTFDEPIDALSVRLPEHEANVAIMLDDGWHHFSAENEFDPMLRESDLVMFGAPVTSVVLKGATQDITLHPIRVSHEPATYELAATTFYKAPRILSRRDWGADESFLYRGPEIVKSDEPTQSDTTTTAPNYTGGTRVDDCNSAQKNFPNDFKTSKTITHDSNGERLRWARRYSPDVKLLVVHHTAQKVSGDTRPAVERVRALYDFHANNRGWGDIGYHYLIDEDGGIYEGRSGGDNVVGGHVYCGNVGTVGIALLGNFETEQPSQQQVQSLQWLLDNLANKYHIDLDRNVTFKGKTMSPILRHKDLISTECPGYYMSNAIAQVRNNVRTGNLLANVTFPQMVTATRKSNVQARLSSRLQEAGQQLSRSFYRAKRLTRTAQRVNPNETRLKALQQQLDDSGNNIQRVRAARQARLLSRSRPLTPDPSPSTPVPTGRGENIRIRLSYTGSVATITGNSIGTVRLGKEGNACVSDTGETNPRLNGGILTVSSWDTPNNRFRGTIECRVIDHQLVLINELPLEQYMAGLAEEPDTEPFEKQKAFAVAARSYAAHYMQPGNVKFPGMPYHGSDSPAQFQKYGGVTFEGKNPHWLQAVEATSSAVLMKDGDILKAAYYSSNDGRTRSPAENGWQNFPHAEVFNSKPDPWCKGFTLRGHGVGMSGCGAKGQAEEGKTFSDILKYYYPGTTVATNN